MIIYDPKITGSFQINGSTISSVGQIDSISGSVDSLTQASSSFSSRVSLAEGSVNSLNSASSSYLLNITDTLDGDLTVTGRITAQEFHTEFVSASIVYESGSTQFGNSSDDTHVFTGSISIQGGGVTSGTDLLSSAAAYTIGTVSDSNIEIGTSAAGTPRMIFRVNGNNERMRIDSSGSVGIGESGPLGKLHIKGSDTGVTAPSAQGNLLVLEDAENGLSILSSTAGAGYINFGDSDDSDVGMIIYGHSSNAMSLWTNAGKRMTIDSTGRVGINTTPSLGGVRLHTYNNSTDAYNIFESSANKWVFGEAGGICQIGGLYGVHTGITINTAGNVGIGKTSPAYPLHVENGTGGYSAGFDDGVIIGEGGTTPGDLFFATITGATNTFQTGSRVFQTFADNNGAADASIYFNRTNGTGGGVTSGTCITFHTSKNTYGPYGRERDQERMRITGNGNIQHNFNPGEGSYYWRDTTNGAVMFYLIPATYKVTTPYNSNRIVAANSSYIGFETGGAERMTIVNDGQVIINGTQGASTSPWPLRIEAGNGGVQARFTRVNAYADMFMGGVDSNATQFFIRSGGINGVRLDYAATSWASASDINLKNINHELTGILPKLQNIRAVNFSWKEDESNTENLGVIAQEVEAEFPQLVSVSEIDGMKGVKYTEFVPILLAAVKEQQAIIEDLKARIQTLENS